MRRAVRGRAARLAKLVPAGPARAARTPFVLLVVVLLGSGLISLLLLNSSLNQGSFKLSKLKKQTTELTEEEQALQQEVDAYAALDVLERRARKLGMVPGGSPAFLSPDGTVRGVPSAAPATPSALGAPSAPLPVRPGGTSAGRSAPVSGRAVPASLFSAPPAHVAAASPAPAAAWPLVPAPAPGTAAGGLAAPAAASPVPPSGR